MLGKQDELYGNMGEAQFIIFVAVVLPVFFSGCLISAFCEPGWDRCVIMRWSIVAALFLFALADLIVDVIKDASRLERERAARNYVKTNTHLVCT